MQQIFLFVDAQISLLSAESVVDAERSPLRSCSTSLTEPHLEYV